VPVVVSFAPAFLLRHPVDKAKAWADLCLAVRTLDGTESGGAALDS
jgi:DNA polymerase